MSLPAPPPDVGAPWPGYEYPTSCQDPVTPEPGVVQFRDFTLAHWGGSSTGIIRPCVPEDPDLHMEGRAWDWTVSADNPEDRARVDAWMAWLFANDGAAIKRLGISNIIWDHQRWSQGTSWRAGPKYGDPHTTHVHIGFTRGGAGADHQWLWELPAQDQPLGAAPGLSPPRRPAWPVYAGLALAGAATWWERNR